MLWQLFFFLVLFNSWDGLTCCSKWSLLAGISASCCLGLTASVPACLQHLFMSLHAAFALPTSGQTVSLFSGRCKLKRVTLASGLESCVTDVQCAEVLVWTQDWALGASEMLMSSVCRAEMSRGRSALPSGDPEQTPFLRTWIFAGPHKLRRPFPQALGRRTCRCAPKPSAPLPLQAQGMPGVLWSLSRTHRTVKGLSRAPSPGPAKGATACFPVWCSANRIRKIYIFWIV